MSEKPGKWNTPKIALYGAAVGAIYPGVLHFPLSAAGDDVAFWLGSMTGGALGVAVLAALVSAVRNLLVR
jgi:threonine/homoserine efflux transporter RhtA